MALMKADKLLQCHDDTSMISIPVYLRPTMGMHHVLDGKAMKVVLIAENSDDVPAEAIDRYPPCGQVIRSPLREHLRYAVVVSPNMANVIPRVIDNVNVAMRFERKHLRRNLVVGGGCVDARFGSWLPDRLTPHGFMVGSNRLSSGWVSKP